MKKLITHITNKQGAAVKIEQDNYSTDIGISRNGEHFFWFPITKPIAKLVLTALKQYIEE